MMNVPESGDVRMVSRFEGTSQESRNDPVVMTFYEDLHASLRSMIAEFAQSLGRPPNRDDMGQADRNRPAEYTHERALEVGREVDVLFCVLLAGSQFRIGD